MADPKEGKEKKKTFQEVLFFENNLPVLMPMAILLLGIIVFSLLLWRFFSNDLIPMYRFELADLYLKMVWTLATVSLLAATIAGMFYHRTQVSGIARETEERSKNAVATIENAVLEFIKPTILFKQDNTQMREILIDKFVAFIDEELSESDMQKFTIIGADNLAPDQTEHEKFIERFGKPNGCRPSEIDPKTNKKYSVKEYEERLKYEYGCLYYEIIESPKVTSRRYMFLLSPEQFYARTEAFRKKYLGWLQRKVDVLKSNLPIEIFHTPRAITYGAPTSLLIFGKTMVQLYFGENGGGVIISGEDIVNPAKEALVNYLDPKDMPNKEKREMQIAIYKKGPSARNEFEKAPEALGDLLEDIKNYVPPEGS